jgi:exosome complex protein LRP1
MDSSFLEPLLADLKGNIDALYEALDPILQNSISDSAGKLPVLDKAKFYVLITYTLESIIFCTY